MHVTEEENTGADSPQLGGLQWCMKDTKQIFNSIQGMDKNSLSKFPL